MSRPSAQRTARHAGQHLLLYDGVCGLCDRFVQFVLPRDRRGLFRFAPLQSAVAAEHLARVGVRAAAVDTISVIANYETEAPRRLTKSRAVIHVMSSLGWPWRVAALMRVLPTTLLDRAYDLVAGNRYRVFGRNETCLLPRPEYVDRFVDIEPSLPPTPKGHDSTSPGEAV